MLSAFGRRVIVRDDEAGSALVNSTGCPCVTLAGNIHERGRLSGGYRESANSAFRMLRERQVAQDDESTATSASQAIADQLAVLLRAERLVVETSASESSMPPWLELATSRLTAASLRTPHPCTCSCEVSCWSLLLAGASALVGQLKATQQATGVAMQAAQLEAAEKVQRTVYREAEVVKLREALELNGSGRTWNPEQGQDALCALKQQQSLVAKQLAAAEERQVCLD